MRLTLEFLGSGTSVGVPCVGCQCSVCMSTDSRNKRLRPSVLVRAWDGERLLTTVIIDTGPDFRSQMLRANVQRLDAVIISHYHYDHVVGIDDVRRYNHLQHQIIDCWGSMATLDRLRHSFAYVFTTSDELRPGLPNIRTKTIVPYEPFFIGPLQFEPLEQDHAVMPSLGFRISAEGSPAIAYCLDVKTIPAQSYDRLAGVDTFIVDMLREKLHPTHMNLDEALEAVARIKPRRAFFSHIAHETDHALVESKLPAHVRIAYDGLILETQ